MLRVARPNGTTNKPWPRAMRRMANSALLPLPNIDHSLPSRRVIAQIALALDPKTPENIRPKSIIYEPRTASNISAKRCVTILDTSGSMFGDPKLISDCIKEISTICKRRSEEHTSELQSLMRISYAVFCLQKKKPPQK